MHYERSNKKPLLARIAMKTSIDFRLEHTKFIVASKCEFSSTHLVYCWLWHRPFRWFSHIYLLCVRIWKYSNKFVLISCAVPFNAWQKQQSTSWSIAISCAHLRVRSLHVQMAGQRCAHHRQTCANRCRQHIQLLSLGFGLRQWVLQRFAYRYLVLWLRAWEIQWHHRWQQRCHGRDARANQIVE